MTNHPRNDGPVRPRGDTDENRRQLGNQTGGPADPGNDNNGRPTIKSWWDVFKIIFAVTLWFTTTDASIALREAAKYVDLSKAISLLGLGLGTVPNTVLWGALLGVAHGLILAIKAIVFIWVGPTFFEYLYPVFVAASRLSARMVTDVRRAWTTWGGGFVGPDDGPPRPPCPPANGGGGDTPATREAGATEADTQTRTDAPQSGTTPPAEQGTPPQEKRDAKGGDDTGERK